MRKETGSFEPNMVAKIGNCLPECPFSVLLQNQPDSISKERHMAMYKCLLTLPCMHILSSIFPFSV